MEKEVEISLEVKRPESYLLLGVLVGVLVLELWVTFGSNVIFGDEGFHTHMARWLAQNLEIPSYIPLYGTELYQLSYTRYFGAHITVGSLFFVFGFSEFLLKLFLPLISIMGAIVFYKFANEFISKKLAFLASLFYLSFPVFVTYSVLFYSDTILMFFITLSIYFFYKSYKEGDIRMAILTGIFTGFSIITKKAGFVLPFIYVLWFLWKYNVKKLNLYFTIATIALLIIGPWYMRNFLIFNTPLCGFPGFPTNLCERTPTDPAYTNVERVPAAGGTDVPLLQMGLVNFIDFAYSLPLFVISIFGIIYIFLRKREVDKFIMFLILVLIFILGQQSWGGAEYRTEDFARYMVPSIIPLALVGYIYSAAVYNLLSKYHKFLGVIFIAAVLFFSFSAIKSKADVMRSVKQFSTGFFEGSKWIKENTPEDSIILSLWTHQTVYTAQRQSYWPQELYIPIFTYENETSVQMIKENGFDYIFVQKWSIVEGPFYQGYPASFVSWLDSSVSFEKAYENSDVLIYKVV